MGAHFVILNASRLKVPEGSEVPERLRQKAKDWRLSWFVLAEVGVATFSASGQPIDLPLFQTRPTFHLCSVFQQYNSEVPKRLLRLVVCKPEIDFRQAKQRLLDLKRSL